MQKHKQDSCDCLPVPDKAGHNNIFFSCLIMFIYRALITPRKKGTSSHLSANAFYKFIYSQITTTLFIFLSLTHTRAHRVEEIGVHVLG